MAFDVKMTAYARHRFSETISFIQYVCGKASYATNLLNATRDVLENLKTQEGFRIVDHDISDLVGEIVYRVKSKQNTILVFLFMHESQPSNEDIVICYKADD